MTASESEIERSGISSDEGFITTLVGISRRGALTTAIAATPISTVPFSSEKPFGLWLCLVSKFHHT